MRRPHHRGPIVVPFTCDIPRMHGRRAASYPLVGGERYGRIKTVITDSCARNCRVNILPRRVPEFLIFSRPLVGRVWIFRRQFTGTWFNFACKYSTLRVGAIGQLGERLHGMQKGSTLNILSESIRSAAP